MTAPARTRPEPDPPGRPETPAARSTPAAGPASRSGGIPPSGLRRRVGLAACLCSALGFGALPVLGKDAYEAGLGPLSLLWGRFGLAAIAFWLLVVFVVKPVRPSAALVVTGLLMGSLGYALEAGLFFVALERVDASLVELLLYAYPAIVTAAALMAPGGREAPGPRLLGALALATLGVILVFAGSLASGVDAVGLALGLGSAIVYAGYILVGERAVAGVHPVLLAALVATGATVSFSLAGLVDGGALPVPGSAGAWRAVAVIAAVATVIPMAALFTGIERVGAPTASIVSTFEPVVTVVLAGLVLGERLSLVEAAGAACVLAAVRLLARRPAQGRQAVSGSSTGG